MNTHTSDTSRTSETSTTSGTGDGLAPADRPVTVLGLGPMGRALAAAFLAAGHPTTVWNRTPERAAGLVADGAVLAGSAAEAVAASPLTIVCVLDYDALDAIVVPAAPHLRGRTLVSLTNDTPQRARKTAAWAAEHGIDYLDGAIMTPTVTIGTPQAVLLVSGPESVHEEHRATLASLGGTLTHLGTDPGRAAAFDVALLDFFWTSMSGLVHAFALAAAEGIRADELAAGARTISAILPGVIASLGEEAAEGRHSGEDSNLRSAVAGMRHIIEAAHETGIDTSTLAAAKAIADRAVADGHGERAFSILAETLRQPSA